MVVALLIVFNIRQSARAVAILSAHRVNDAPEVNGYRPAEDRQEANARAELIEGNSHAPFSSSPGRLDGLAPMRLFNLILA